MVGSDVFPVEKSSLFLGDEIVHMFRAFVPFSAWLAEICTFETLLPSSLRAHWIPETVKLIFFIFPQIAIAIGVLTSKKGGGRRTTLADWTWHQAGAIVGCHCRVLWLGEGDDQL